MRAKATLLALVMVASVSAQSVVNINGKDYAVDTLEHYQVGPGTIYSQFNIQMGSILHRMYLLEVDLTNPYIRLEECQARYSLGSTELMVDAHERLDSVGHRPIGSVNCNFWVVSGNINSNPEAVRIWTGLLGQPFSGTAHDGVLIGDPSDWNRGARTDNDPNHEVGFFMIDAAKRAIIDDLRYGGYVKIEDESYPLRDCNRTRVTPNDDELVIFNHYIGKPTRTLDDITEVVVRLEDEWCINKEMKAIVTDVNTKGGTTIAPGYAVIQGRGAGKRFLDNLRADQSSQLHQLLEGDELTINLVCETRQDGTRYDIREMVTGNAIVLFDGQQTSRNYNEDYNNRNYPRTMLATNDAGNYVWMLVSATPGNYTSEMASLLQNVGATYAVGMDGGGSAQMNLFGQIQNKTTEGSPRAVANSLFVVNTAPDDREVTELRTTNLKITLPQWGVYKPRWAAYNKYGTLVDRDLQGVRLECSEQTGYITDDGYFVCTGNGTLRATYGQATTDIEVRMVESEVRLRLDTVFISDDTDYRIEMLATVGNDDIVVLPRAFKWSVDNADVCEVTDEGIVRGLANGTAEVSTFVGDKKLRLGVIVQIPQSRPLLVDDFVETFGEWQMKASETKWNAQFAINESNKAAVSFSFTSGRNANIRMSRSVLLWSLPKKLELRLNPGALTIKKMSFMIQANTADKAQLIVLDSLSLPLNTVSSVFVNLDSVFSASEDISVYPLELQSFTIYLDNAVKGEDYNVVLDGIWLHYGNEPDNTRLPSVSASDGSRYGVRLVGDMPLVVNGLNGDATVRVYDMSGRLVLETQVTAERNTIDTEQLARGWYVVEVRKH